MATVYHAAPVEVPAQVAWDFLERYSRSEVHVFSVCVNEYQDGDYRVVVLADGSEVRERNVSVDPERMRAAYTVPGLGAEHNQAEMRLVVHGEHSVVLGWCTDVLPNEFAEQLRGAFEPMFQELLNAVNHHQMPQT
jgi:hypothetical protein